MRYGSAERSEIPARGCNTKFLLAMEGSDGAMATPPPASSSWRLAAARLRPWPDDPPHGVHAYHHGWVHRGNERLLRRLIATHRPRVIVELGSWLGLCTTLLLEASEAHGAPAVFAIDRWDPQWLLEHQLGQYERDAEALAMLRGDGDSAAPLPLFETFLVNMWAHRTRLFPVRMSTLDGLEAVRALGAPVGLVYVDADHSAPAVLADLRAARKCFPRAVLCGDDWQWPTVRAAVRQYAAESGGGAHAHPEENWFWIEQLEHGGGARAEQPPRAPSSDARRAGDELPTAGCDGDARADGAIARPRVVEFVAAQDREPES